jgi:hypothetical protein
MSRKVEMALGAIEQKILRIIYGLIQENAPWSIHYNITFNGLCNNIDVATHTKLRGLEWAGHNCSMDG